MSRDLHHETIHARLVVPKDATVEPTRDANGYPRIDVKIDAELLTLQFDSGIGRLGVTLADEPPTVYGLPVEKSEVGPTGVAARYRDARGVLRILGVAPGVSCKYETVLAAKPETLARIFTTCASLRSPAPGPWRASTPEERAHGGMTDVPEGAWVEVEPSRTPGAALRPGPFVARLHAGSFMLHAAECPASYDALTEKHAPEIEVTTDRKLGISGELWVRRATDRDGDRSYPGATTVIVKRASGPCCQVDFVPWTTPTSREQIEYVGALCRSFSR